jgi:3-oxoacyl-[acyl-carrier protein] reductase
MQLQNEASGRERRPLALVTGASRQRGIAAAVAVGLAAAGWDVATTYLRRYDERMPWGSDADDLALLDAQLRQVGAATLAVAADLADPNVPARIFDAVESTLGNVTALLLVHAESVDSSILDTTLDSFDRHFAVNARANWLLIREFATRFRSAPGSGRIVALTSDHVAGNLPYGASKGALDRIVVAAAREFGHLGITANVINPGATDTGWMSAEQMQAFAGKIPLGRVSVPRDCANLVTFLCSSQGGWITGQLLQSNGGSQ